MTDPRRDRGLRQMLMRMLDEGERSDPPAVIEALRTVATNPDDDDEARRSAAHTLSGCGPRGIEPLRQLACQAFNIPVQLRLKTAVHALESIGGETARDILRGSRSDPDAEIMEAATRALLDQSGEPAHGTGDVSAARPQVTDDDSPPVPESPHEHPSDDGDPTAGLCGPAEYPSDIREALLGNLSDIDSHDLWRIARGMLDCDDNAVIPVLCELLTRTDSTVRMYAARELGRLAGSAARRWPRRSRTRWTIPPPTVAFSPSRSQHWGRLDRRRSHRLAARAGQDRTQRTAGWTGLRVLPHPIVPTDVTPPAADSAGHGHPGRRGALTAIVNARSFDFAQSRLSSLPSDPLLQVAT